MALDIRTTIMIAALLALIIGVSLRFVMRDYPASLLPSMRLWAIGTLLLPTAWMLYSLRGDIPDFLSIVIANALLGFAFALQVESVRAFVGRLRSRALVLVPVAAIVVCECMFTYPIPSVRARAITVSTIIGVQLACAVRALWVHGQVRRRSQMLTVAAFATLSLTLLFRAMFDVVSGTEVPGPFVTSFMESAAFGLGSAFPIAATLGFLLMCNDRLNRSLARKEEHLRAITDNLPTIVAHIDTMERFTFANAYFAQLLDVDPGEIVGRTMLDVLGPVRDEMRSSAAAALRGEAVTFETECDFLGEHRYFEASYVPDIDAERIVRGFFVLIFDISRLKLAKQRLTRLAESDSLTGLANRKKFGDSLALALARAGRSGGFVGVLYIDVDRFKPINDTYGHAVGDAVLREFASRLEGCLRETDLLARIGGDEFAVLVENAGSAQGLEVVASKLLAALDGEFLAEHVALHVAASIGIGIARGDADAKALMQMADRGLYLAKAAGRHTYRIGPSPGATEASSMHHPLRAAQGAEAQKPA